MQPGTVPTANDGRSCPGTPRPARLPECGFAASGNAALVLASVPDKESAGATNYFLGYDAFTNLFGVPSSPPPVGGRQSTTSSIFLANSKSLSVIPPAEWLFSFTHTFAQVTLRSGWCHAASAR
jgi:hypothetical protein